MRAKVTIGAEGLVAVPPRQAEALGLREGDEVAFLSARGACALLVPSRSDAPHAYFAGSLSSLTAAEVVQFVLSSLKTGTLLLAFGGEAEREARTGGPERLRRTSVTFRDGQVVSASSSDPEHRLGAVLARGGFVAEDEIERCAALVRSGHPLGQVLVDEGALTPARLYEALALQVREIFLSIFTESAGEFAFLEGPADEANQVRLPERTRDLVLEGMKRLEALELERAAAGVAAAEEVVIEVEAPALTPPPVPGQRARVRLPRSVGPFETYRRIFKHVYAALAAVEPDAAARLGSWFDGLPENRRGAFEGVRLGPDGDMDVAQVLVNVESSGAYAGAAARARSLEALEEFLSFALFEAKNRLPRAGAERLLREVGRMQVGNP